MTEDEEEIVRKSIMGRGKDEKMIFVGLWRIQTNHSDRASTTGYVDNVSLSVVSVRSRNASFFHVEGILTILNMAEYEIACSAELDYEFI
ncbi:hypothetical protein POTOM_017280 [Populus tomentosa]|uniref:Uncharacterized protein n=1 Tax=Populus tomentosa TaxID=118781 RepID=A0A8X8D4L4_POPTO|nr:hypothetical protein POTOM_017280 [Populus tomentosa]